MKTKERIVHFYDLQLHTLSLDEHVENPSPTEMAPMLDILVKFLKKGMEIGANKNIELVDFQYSHRKAELVMLLNKPDAELSDVTYKDRTTKARRSGNKAPSEAIEMSSHVILTARQGQAFAEVRMTMGAGVYMDRISRLLNDVYDKNSEAKALSSMRNRPHPTNAIGRDNKPMTYSVRHRFEHRAHPNVWLKDILQNGKVQGIELIENGHEIFDVSQPHDMVRKTLQLKPSGRLAISSIRKMVGIASSKHNLEADQLRIDYTSGKGESGKKTFPLNHLDAAFTKSARIELDTEHNQQQSAISNEIVQKMLELD